MIDEDKNELNIQQKSNPTITKNELNIKTEIHDYHKNIYDKDKLFIIKPDLFVNFDIKSRKVKINFKL